MAEETLSRETRKHHLLSTWLLQFARHQALTELIEEKCVKNTDFIQGVLTMSERTDLSSPLVHLIMLMCKLGNGQDYNTRYIPDSELTVLEEVLLSFYVIVRCFTENSALKKDVSKYQIALMKQAVFVCCRAGDFEAASGVYERQWDDDIVKNDKDRIPIVIPSLERKSVQIVLKSKNADHRALKTESYESFIELMTEFAKEANALPLFPEPYLLKVADAYLENKDESNDVTPRKQRRMNPGHFENLPSPTLSSGKKRALHKNISSVRKRVMNNIISTACNGNNSNSIQHQQDETILDDSDDEVEINRKQGKTTVSESLRLSRKQLKEQTENLNSSPESSPQKTRRQNKSPHPSTSKSPNTSISKSPRPKPSPDKPTPDSSSKNIRKFRYRKNMNRGNRHKGDTEDEEMQPSTEDSDYSGLSIGDSLESEDDEVPRKRLDLKLMPSEKPYYPKRNRATAAPLAGKRRVFWTQKEEEEFYRAVKECGVGNWSDIKRKMRTFRTSVNLKDKWRQFNKSGVLDALEKKFGKVE